MKIIKIQPIYTTIKTRSKNNFVSQKIKTLDIIKPSVFLFFNKYFADRLFLIS